jgi:hypothetical protein
VAQRLALSKVSTRKTTTPIKKLTKGTLVYVVEANARNDMKHQKTSRATTATYSQALSPEPPNKKELAPFTEIQVL